VFGVENGTVSNSGNYLVYLRPCVFRHLPHSEDLSINHDLQLG
jgi:hypothetical protein